jgi:hypothetical protein
MDTMFNFAHGAVSQRADRVGVALLTLRITTGNSHAVRFDVLEPEVYMGSVAVSICVAALPTANTIQDQPTIRPAMLIPRGCVQCSLPGSPVRPTRPPQAQPLRAPRQRHFSEAQSRGS